MSASNCFNSFTITRTYKATDACGNASTCTQLITVNDAASPIITCPPNVTLTCDNCNTDPANTGRAMATDNCLNPVPIITYTDSVSGSCPGLKITKRTWKATDSCGHSQTCVQTIYCTSGSLFTDTLLCTPLNYCNVPGWSFRLLFTQDPQNYPCYKVTSSNPGQFYYNLFYIGTPNATVTLTFAIPYPFVTQGAQPIHAYDGVTTSTSGGVTCLTPGNLLPQWSNQVVLANYPGKFGTVQSVSVTVTVPASGIVYANIHLDYGLKGSTGYTYDNSTSLNAYSCSSGLNTGTLLIPNNQGYTLNTLVNNTSYDTETVTSCNVFKKNPGVGGLVQSLKSSDGVASASAVLTDSSGTVQSTALSDDDGWYMLTYKQTGKAQTFNVKITIGSGKSAWTQTQAVTLKANGYAESDFTSP